METSSWRPNPQHEVKPTVIPLTDAHRVHYPDSHLILTFDVRSSHQHSGKEDVEAFLNGQKDKAGHHGAQVIDDVVNSLVSKAEDIQESHDVAFALCQDLLQERLLVEAPSEPGHRPIDQGLEEI